MVYVVSLKQIDMSTWLFCMDHRLVIDVLFVMTDWYLNIFRYVRCYSEYQVQVMERVRYVG
jgi:cephalosporin-C deacetylase-like acetyl esterase